MPCAAFDVDCDGCGVLNVANVAVEINIGPVSFDFLVEGLEIGDSLVLVFQFASFRAHRSRVLQVLRLLRLQSDDLSGPKVGDNAVVTDGLLDLVEALLESTHSANSNVVLGCGVSVLVLDCGVLTKDVAIADPVNVVARVAVLVSILMEPEGESALGTLLFHPLGRKGNAEKSSEDSADIVGGIVDMAHKGWTY